MQYPKCDDEFARSPEPEQRTNQRVNTGVDHHNPRRSSKVQQVVGSKVNKQDVGSTYSIYWYTHTYLCFCRDMI